MLPVALNTGGAAAAPTTAGSSTGEGSFAGRLQALASGGFIRCRGWLTMRADSASEPLPVVCPASPMASGTLLPIMSSQQAAIVRSPEIAALDSHAADAIATSVMVLVLQAADAKARLHAGDLARPSTTLGHAAPLLPRQPAATQPPREVPDARTLAAFRGSNPAGAAAALAGVASGGTVPS